MTPSRRSPHRATHSTRINATSSTLLVDSGIMASTTTKMWVFILKKTGWFLSRTLYRLTVGSAAGSIRDLFSKIKAIDAKHGKFDLVLCTGDFFGPLKAPEDMSEEVDEISLLLNGSLEGGILLCPSSSWSLILLSCSTFGMLCDAGRTTFAIKRCWKVCEDWRRTVQECVPNKYALSFSVCRVDWARHVFL